MLPMITSVQEVRDAKRILEEAKSELRGERIDFNESIQIGVMIETLRRSLWPTSCRRSTISSPSAPTT